MVLVFQKLFLFKGCLRFVSNSLEALLASQNALREKGPHRLHQFFRIQALQGLNKI
jgi:hypothetical protein